MNTPHAPGQENEVPTPINPIDGANQMTNGVGGGMPNGGIPMPQF